VSEYDARQYREMEVALKKIKPSKADMPGYMG